MAVRVARQGQVTVVTLDRPQVRNAVDGEHAQALYDAFAAFDTDPDAAVAVFYGAGGSFCAGADLKAVAAGAMPVWPPGEGRGPMGPTRMSLVKPERCYPLPDGMIPGDQPVTRTPSRTRTRCELLEAERKAGVQLQAMADRGERHTRGGDQRSNGQPVTLIELGVAPKQASRWQQLARLPDQALADYVAAHPRTRQRRQSRNSDGDPVG